MRTRLKFALPVAAFLLACTLGSSPALRPASAADAEAEIDISVFYRALAPHGEWIEIQPYGWAWVPDNVDYDWRPYTVGQWAWVEPYGWTWISEEPWGWATYHYGRWTYHDDYGWAWVPGTTWAPAWVAFRYGDPWVGWAPLPPGPSWRFDAAVDTAGLNADVSIGTHAWTFVPVRYFAEPNPRTRFVMTTHNHYLVQRTQWSTRYATVEGGGVSNRSIDVAAVERARSGPVPRRRLQVAQAPEAGAGVRVEGDAVVLYRPRIAAKAAAAPPDPRARVSGPGGTPRVSLDTWTAQRQAALKAHLEAQRKALEAQDPEATEPGEAKPNPVPVDTVKRREAGLKALEDERKRLEALLDRQRKRLERQSGPDAPTPAPPAKPDDSPSKEDKHKSKKDKDKSNKEKDPADGAK